MRFGVFAREGYGETKMEATMKQVTKDEFYAALYADKRDIMPRIVNNWNEEIGYIQEWRTQHGGVLFGKTDGRVHFNNERYFLAA